MNTLKVLIKISAFIYIFVLLTAPLDFAFAGSDDLALTKITRISHPNYRAGNMWYSLRNPWNRDFTRIMMYEIPSDNNGRGLVWGFVSDLKSWTTLAEYKTSAKPFPDTARITTPTSAYWSPFPGEENIIYAPYYSGSNCSFLKKINMDTNTATNVISINPKDGTNCRNARALGWTADNTLIVNFDDESWSSGGYEVDVQQQTRTRYSSRPSKNSSEGIRWPYISHGHSDRSPDGNWIISYSQSGNYISDPFGSTRRENYYKLTNLLSVEETYLPLNSPRNLGYASWKASSEWWLASDLGGGLWGANSPIIDDYGFWQVWPDGTRKLIFTHSTAQTWTEVLNWGAHTLPVLREDGKQIFFTSTDGKFTKEDNDLRGVTPWGYEGFFLADLVPVSAPGQTLANPTGLLVGQ